MKRFIACVIFLNVLIFPKEYKLTELPGYPFVVGETFKSIADFVLDDTKDFNPKAVHNPSIIFVKTSKLKIFFENYHNNISVKYILITHDNISNVPKTFWGDFTHYLNDQKIIHWFGKNASLDHPKLTPIPLGPNLGVYGNFYCFQESKYLQFKKKFESAHTKKYLAYLNFKIATNKEREPLFNQFKDKEYVLVEGRREFEEYLIKLKESYFVFSPHGYGLDCHRTWEALLMGCIPIITTSALDRLYANLPVLIVKKWSDVNEALLKNFLKTKNIKFDCSKLFAEYWINLILSKFSSH